MAREGNGAASGVEVGMPVVTAMSVEPLRPELMSAVFGRERSVLRRVCGPSWGGRGITIAVAVVGMAAVLLLAAGLGQLDATGTAPSALTAVVQPSNAPVHVSLPLWQDPEGIVFLLVAFLLPVIGAEQVAGIGGLAAMSERNLGARAASVPAAEINTLVAAANRRFEWLGSRRVSAYYLVAAGAFSAGLCALVNLRGLLASWNRGTIPTETWRRLVYDGWWANWHHQPALALALWAAGTYGAYFLGKQITMGFVFILFAQAARHRGFGVPPNVMFNTDGYWGLRPLRHLMQWTYASTVSLLVITMGFWLFWLPADQWSVLALIAVVLIDVLTVVYPTMLAYSASIASKTAYVAEVAAGDESVEARQAAIDRVWATPNMPFRLGAGISAVAVYLVVPIILAVVTHLLGG